MRANRINKHKNTIKRLKAKSLPVIARSQLDVFIFDLVLKSLYDNADKNVLSLESDIYAPNKIKLPPNESERIWDVLNSSGLINPVIGFGNFGKIELSKSGYQLMSQYGSYSNFLHIQQGSNLQAPSLPAPRDNKPDD